MVNKRRATADSDSEDQRQDSQPAKRARTNDDDSDSEPEITQPKREKTNGKGKGKATRRKDDESDEDMAQPIAGDNEEEEKLFEEKHGEAIRAALDAKRKVQGGIAEFGIIEHVEMIDFMCHKFLTFTFGPQINFIIGHNGSGKSAVLSAITVALGGKANSTGRGNGLKSFIREGQEVSEVTITMKNQGEEAYKPKEYGKSIVITRRFSKTGTSTWKIKSKDGKTVSTKKDELAAICDHMNIQVDNPMNVLTQDAARQFLSASAPTDKYNFFLRGTQLSQLSEEYDTCLENIKQTTKVLNQKREAIPELKRVFKEAKVRFEEASKAREQHRKADELKKELAWSHVATKQEEMTKRIQEVAKAASRITKLEREVEKANAEFVETTTQVAHFEEKHAELGDMEDLESRRQVLKAEMTENRTKISEYKQNITEMNNSLRVMNETIHNFETQIAEEARRLEVNTQGKREETQRKLQDATNKVEQATAHLKSLEEETATTEGQLSTVLADGKTAEEEVKNIQSQIQHHDTMIRQCQQQQQNVFQPYGNNMQRVVDSIGSMQWHGTPPVGPFGLCVKVRDTQRWAKLLRTQIGAAMSSFAITDSRDHAQLKRLLTQSGNKNQIIISERDEFDYSSGEPSDPNIITALRALDISNEYVLRLLINQFQIERTILAPTRGEADQLLQGFSSGGVAWSADGMRVQRFPEGGLSSTKLTPINNPSDPRNLLFTGKDAAGQLREWQEALARITPTLKDAQNKYNQVKQELSRLGNAVHNLKNQSKLAFREVEIAKQAKTVLQGEANEELPVSLSALEDAKTEMVGEKDFLKQQFTDVSIKKGEVDEAQKPLQEQINEIKKQMDEFKQRADEAQAKVTTAVVARKKAQSDITYYKDKLSQEQTVHVDLETKCATVTAEFEDWTAKALQFCPEILNPRKPDVVQRDLNATNNALKERERRHGASVEEMTVEVNKAKANLDSAEKELKNMWSLNKALGSSLQLRLARWQEFRRHIALRCKLVFQYHLSNRGYYGKVLFNHEAGTLQLKVQTDEQAQTQGARDKDPRSLSGGEKSFSTICLLLSLWESIGCPLRCLDEFDVFMDAVNRRISMRMMIDTANASDKKQYILITPLSVNMEIGPSVRVHRMSDPERGQATLPFN